jgi:hypothetical protein
MRTFPAQITGQTIRYWSGNEMLATIDRYSGIMTNNAGNTYKCMAASGPAIP